MEFKGERQSHTSMEGAQTDKASWKCGQFGKTVHLKLLFGSEISFQGLKETDTFVVLTLMWFTDSTLTVGQKTENNLDVHQ